MLKARDRYLGVDYLLADILLRTYGSDRRKLLHQAAALLENFLTRLDSYELLSKQSKELFEHYQDNRETFQLASATDTAERRRIKVARFQEEKGLRTKLEVFGCFGWHAWISDRRLAPEN